MKTEQTVDEYINVFPDSVKKRLVEIRQLIQKLAPESEEKIAWQMPGYKLNGKPLIYFAGFKNHIGLYPLPESIDKFKKELSQYKQGKGSVQFPHSENLPLNLIEEIIRSRIDEIKMIS